MNLRSFEPGLVTASGSDLGQCNGYLKVATQQKYLVFIYFISHPSVSHDVKVAQDRGVSIHKIQSLVKPKPPLKVEVKQIEPNDLRIFASDKLR